MPAPASILLVGLGGAGCSMVTRLAPQLPPEVTAALLDTDARSLPAAGERAALQLGRAQTRGMGTGGEAALGLASILNLTLEWWGSDHGEQDAEHD